MNILRRGLLGLAVLGAAGTGVGVGLAATASASPPQTVQYTGQAVLESVISPGIVQFQVNEYQPTLLAPGFRLAAVKSEICVVANRARIVCTWRLTSTSVGNPQLIGNWVSTPTGEVGAVTGGTGGWFGAKGIYKAANLIPGADSETYVFSTP